MGFPIRMIQVDNGSEFVNDGDRTERESAFEKAAKALNMELKRIRPYSPWQNGKVERSHREDGKIFYGRKAFRAIGQKVCVTNPSTPDNCSNDVARSIQLHHPT